MTVPFSAPDWESVDVILVLPGRDGALGPAKDSRPLRGLPVVVLARDVADDIEDCRPTLDAGTAGGPIDVLVPPTEGRAFAETDVARAFDGVAVRDVDALVAVLPSCFTGDFVGD